MKVILAGTALALGGVLARRSYIVALRWQHQHHPYGGILRAAAPDQAFRYDGLGVQG